MTFTSSIRTGKGDGFIIDGVLYTILGRDKLGFTLQSTGSQRFTISKTHEELAALYFDGKERLRIIRGDVAALPLEVQANLARPLDAFRPQDVQIALKRLEFCHAMDRYVSRKVVSKTKAGYNHIAKVVARYRRLRTIHVDKVRHDKVPEEYVGWSTLRDWFWRFERGKCAQALIPANEKKGKAPDRLDPEVTMAIAFRITTKYLTMERPDLSVVHDLIVGDLEAANVGRVGPLALPTIDAVRRWVRRNVTAYEQIYYRHGALEAELRRGNQHENARQSR